MIRGELVIFSLLFEGGVNIHIGFWIEMWIFLNKRQQSIEKVNGVGVYLSLSWADD